MINFKRKKEEKNLFQSSAGNKPNKGFAEKKDEKRVIEKGDERIRKLEIKFNS